MDIRDELLRVFQNKNIGLRAVIIICEVISADARYNIWFADVVKKQATKQQALECIEHYERLTGRCAAIVKKFEEDHDLRGFEAALQELTEQMVSSMSCVACMDR